jgi:hypothetical protein
VHAVLLPLFGAKSPTFQEVKQAPGLANCPVAAILAALAFTSSGRTVLQKLLSETAAATLTELSNIKAADLSNPPAGMKVTSARYFTVSLPGGAVDVSDVLYTNDADSNWSPLYMQDPADKCLWAAIIEKGLAVQLGSYENFDALPLTANDFFEKLVGAKPGGFAITESTPLTKITEAAKAATRTATIGASKDEGVKSKSVSAFHGHAMLGLDGAKIKLYDPAKATTILITPAEFRQDFKAILFQK